MSGTGIELLAAKAAAPAVGKLLGWGTKGLWKRWKDGRVVDKVRAGLESDPESDAFLKVLSPEQSLAVSEFLGSAEAEHFAVQLATSKYLNRSGADAFPREVLEGELRSLLRLHTRLSFPELETVTQGIYTQLNLSVDLASKVFLGDTGSLPEATRVSLLKSAGAQTIAVTRNSELLQNVSRVGDITKFEAQYKAQVASLHSSMRLPHSNTSRMVSYDRLFVPPRIGLGKEADDVGEEEWTIDQVLARSLQVVILGDPGGGKSTLTLKHVYDVARRKPGTRGPRVPFLVVLKDYADIFNRERTSLMDYIESLTRTPYSVQAPDGAVEYLLMNGAGIVVFDGLDELLDTSLRRDVVQAVEGFTHRFPTTQALVTSRRVGYDEAPLDPELFSVATLENFAPEQVENYARKWFSLDESVPRTQRTILAESFLTDSEYVADLRVNPLMLSLMCGLYSYEKYIPKNRPDVYEKCALLLFERWDKQRGIVAPLPFDAHVMSSLRSCSRSGLTTLMMRKMLRTVSSTFVAVEPGY